MNNPHQELIEKSVDEFCDFDFYTDGGNIGAKEVEAGKAQAHNTLARAVKEFISNMDSV